jgi:ribosomal protein S18 acetylase RimI-like enzyme
MDKPRQLTLIAQLNSFPRTSLALPDGYELRLTSADDKRGLSDLYFASYPEEIVKDISEALEEMEVTFEGEYGQLDLSSSPVLVFDDQIVASVLTVLQAPWDDTPPGPFIIEVIVHPEHRRRGLAEYLMIDTASRLVGQGRKTVSLRVMSNNEGALSLYGRMGFVEWVPPEGG